MSTTSIPAAAADTLLLAANPARIGASIFNNSATATLLLKFGPGASTTSFKIPLTPLTGFVFVDACFRGQVNGFWTGAIAGAALVAEE